MRYLVTEVAYWMVDASDELDAIDRRELYGRLLDSDYTVEEHAEREEQ